MSSPKYLKLDAVQIADSVQLIVAIQAQGVWHKVMRVVSDQAVKEDGLAVVAQQLRLMADELLFKQQ